MKKLTTVFSTLSAAIGTLWLASSPTPQLSAPAALVDTSDSFSLYHGCSLSTDQVNSILEGTPAAGTGQFWVDACQTEGIDNAYALGMFAVESNYGRASNWAGWKADGTTTHNVGNIICSQGFPCVGRFSDYPDWQTGIDRHLRLLRCYRDAGGPGCDGLWVGGEKLGDIRTAINRWAPAEDNNDPSSYANTVERLTREWRGQLRQPIVPGATSIEKYNVTSSMAVNAHFTTVDCTFWGNQPGCQHLGTDYAGVEGDPVFAPFKGTYYRTGAYAPGDPACPRCLGEYFMYHTEDGCELYFGHLQGALHMPAEAEVTAGMVIGYIRGDLAHTHVQLKCNDVLMDFETYFTSH